MFFFKYYHYQIYNLWFYFRTYNDSIVLTDKIVQEVEKLITEHYNDNSTAFIFSSDHGMTDWGEYSHIINISTTIIVYINVHYHSSLTTLVVALKTFVISKNIILTQWIIVINNYGACCPSRTPKDTWTLITPKRVSILFCLFNSAILTYFI